MSDVEYCEKKLGPYKRAVLAAQEWAGTDREEGEGYILHCYPD